MKKIVTAVFKDKLDAGKSPVFLQLIQIEPTVFRWTTETGKPFNGVDYLDSGTAIKQLRVLVETDSDYASKDLTIYPSAPAPEDRAAARVFRALYPAEDTQDWPNRADIEIAAAIIREETQTDVLLEKTQTLMAYLIQRRLAPKPAGLDMAQAGLILEVIEVIEKILQTDLGNLKKLMAKDVDGIKVYSSMPDGGKVQ